MTLMVLARHINPLQHNNLIKKNTFPPLHPLGCIYFLFPSPFGAMADFLHGGFGGIYSELVDMDIMQMDDLPFQP